MDRKEKYLKHLLKFINELEINKLINICKYNKKLDYLVEVILLLFYTDTDFYLKLLFQELNDKIQNFINNVDYINKLLLILILCLITKEIKLRLVNFLDKFYKINELLNFYINLNDNECLDYKNFYKIFNELIFLFLKLKDLFKEKHFITILENIENKNISENKIFKGTNYEDNFIIIFNNLDILKGDINYLLKNGEFILKYIKELNITANKYSTKLYILKEIIKFLYLKNFIDYKNISKSDKYNLETLIKNHFLLFIENFFTKNKNKKIKINIFNNNSKKIKRLTAIKKFKLSSKKKSFHNISIKKEIKELKKENDLMNNSSIEKSYINNASKIKKLKAINDFNKKTPINLNKINLVNDNTTKTIKIENNNKNVYFNFNSIKNIYSNNTNLENLKPFNSFILKKEKYDHLCGNKELNIFYDLKKNYVKDQNYYDNMIIIKINNISFENINVNKISINNKSLIFYKIREIKDTIEKNDFIKLYYFIEIKNYNIKDVIFEIKYNIFNYEKKFKFFIPLNLFNFTYNINSNLENLNEFYFNLDYFKTIENIINYSKNYEEKLKKKLENYVKFNNNNFGFILKLCNQIFCFELQIYENNNANFNWYTLYNKHPKNYLEEFLKSVKILIFFN